MGRQGSLYVQMETVRESAVEEAQVHNTGEHQLLGQNGTVFTSTGFGSTQPLVSMVTSGNIFYLNFYICKMSLRIAQLEQCLYF